MARKIAKKEIDLDAGTVTFEFADGQVLVCDVKELSKDMHKRALLHGLAQKVGDAYSGADSAAEALEAAGKAYTSIKEGNWNVGRAEGEGTPRIGQLVKALAKVAGKTEEEALAVVEAMEDEQKKQLRAHPQIKVAMAELRAAEAKAKAKKETGEAPDLSTMFATE